MVNSALNYNSLFEDIKISSESLLLESLISQQQQFAKGDLISNHQSSVNHHLLEDLYKTEKDIKGEVNMTNNWQSIDKVIIEKIAHKMICFDLGEIFWQDIGSFKGLISASEHFGSEKLSNIEMHQSTNSYAYSVDKPVYVIGVDKLIVLNIDDKIIVVSSEFAKNNLLSNAIEEIESNIANRKINDNEK